MSLLALKVLDIAADPKLVSKRSTNLNILNYHFLATKMEEIHN
jgi:hypothetical protein